MEIIGKSTQTEIVGTFRSQLISALIGKALDAVVETVLFPVRYKGVK